MFINYFVYNTKTVFMPFKFLYPECFFLIKEHPNMYPLQCLQYSCSVNKNCMETLVKKVHYLFNEVEPLGEMIISYFGYHNQGNSIKAGIFTKDLDEPRLITVNRSAFDKYRNNSIIKQWLPTQEFNNVNNTYKTDNIIPVHSLIK